LLPTLVTEYEGETDAVLFRLLDEAASIVGEGRVLLRLMTTDDPLQGRLLSRAPVKWFPEEEWRRYLAFAKTRLVEPRLVLERGKWVLSVPLQCGGRPFGIFAAMSRKPAGFSEIQVSLLLVLTALASTVLHARHVVARAGESLVDEERNRIAMDMHDRLVPELFTMKMGAEACRQHIDGDAGHVEEILDRMQEAISRTMTDVRGYICGLRSQSEEQLDLSAAIERSVRGVMGDGAPKGTLAVEGSPRALSSPVALCLFSITQEAIANILKHAAARSFDVVLRYREREIELRICDDGKGFDAVTAQLRAANDLSGLHNMRERVGRLSGRLSIDSREGEGTQILVLLPMGR